MLLVASVLASMRWLLCDGDGSKKKTRSVIAKKYPARNCISITVLINSKKLDPHQITNITVFDQFEKIKSATRISVIIFPEMVMDTVLWISCSKRCQMGDE